MGGEGKKLKIQIERGRLAMDEKTRDRKRGLGERWGGVVEGEVVSVSGKLHELEGCHV